MNEEELIRAYELLKSYCKNMYACNSDCIFFRELVIGMHKEEYCELCRIVTDESEELGS